MNVVVCLILVNWLSSDGLVLTVNRLLVSCVCICIDIACLWDIFSVNFDAAEAGTLVIIAD